MTFRLKNIRILQDTTPLRYFFQKLTLKGEKRIAKLVNVFGRFRLISDSKQIAVKSYHILPHTVLFPSGSYSASLLFIIIPISIGERKDGRESYISPYLNNTHRFIFNSILFKRSCIILRSIINKGYRSYSASYS